jgi:alpha-mannosidase
MRISLLRGPTSPDPFADLGEHRFVYSLLPHSQSSRFETIAQAYALNDSLIAVGGGMGGTPTVDAVSQASSSVVSTNQPQIVIETIKRAEDGNGIIVRLYDSQRWRGSEQLTCGFPVKAAWRTNLLEENQTELSVDGKTVTLYVKPFEIATVRIVPA